MLLKPIAGVASELRGKSSVMVAIPHWSSFYPGFKARTVDNRLYGVAIAVNLSCTILGSCGSIAVL